MPVVRAPAPHASAKRDEDQLSVKHIDRYLDEFEYRNNNRKNPFVFRDVLIRLMDAKTLPYEKLTTIGTIRALSAGSKG